MAALSLNAQQLDEVVAAYVEWHKHAERVQGAYSTWSGAARSEKPRRYAVYLEELDREQRACEAYAATVARAAAVSGRSEATPATLRRRFGC
jgi:hypothetical protein